MNTNSNKTYCSAPWTSLHLNAKKSFGPCCHIEYKMDMIPTDKKSIMNLFNSSEFIELRKKLISNNLEGSPCLNCIDMKYTQKAYQFYNAEIEFFGKENLTKQKQIQEAYFKKFTIVDYAPIDLLFYTSEKCNLKCIFCTQNIASEQFPLDEFNHLLDEYESSEIDLFSFVGGETLLNQDSLSMIESLNNNSKFSKSLVHIVTNGLLIKKHIELLKSIKNLILIISVDGIEASYEHVRVGGSWAEFEYNLNLILEAREINKNIKLLLRSCVMNSTLHDLNKMVQYAKEREIDLYFSPLFNNDLAAQREENFYEYDLITDDIFDENIDLAMKTADNMPITLDSLRVLKEYYHSKSKERMQFIDFFEKLNQNLNNAPIVVYGSGEFVDKLLNIKYFFSMNIVAFADSDLQKQGKKILNKEIINPNRIIDYATNVFIASAAFETEIENFLNDTYQDKISIYKLTNKENLC